MTRYLKVFVWFSSEFIVRIKQRIKESPLNAIGTNEIVAFRPRPKSRRLVNQSQRVDKLFLAV